MRTGAELEADMHANFDELAQKWFKADAKSYQWHKSLSIWPRKCYWTGKFIRPFTYAMEGWPGPDTAVRYSIIDVNITTPRWITAENFVYLRLKGKV